MPYDEGLDPVRNTPGASTFGKRGRPITKSDSIDFSPYAKALIVLTGGTLKILPSKNADADALTFEALSAGQVIPFQVRRVFATGSTATVAAIDE